MQTGTVRVISPGNIKLGRVSVEEARRRIRLRIARPLGVTRNNFTSIQMLSAQVADSAGTGSGTRYVYDEDLGDGKHMVMLKRIGHDGVPHRWDENLSFAELRSGKMLSAITVQRNREMSTLRRSIG